MAPTILGLPEPMELMASLELTARPELPTLPLGARAAFSLAAPVLPATMPLPPTGAMARPGLMVFLGEMVEPPLEAMEIAAYLLVRLATLAALC
jgi:hypothetical protein